MKRCMTSVKLDVDDILTLRLGINILCARWYCGDKIMQEQTFTNHMPDFEYS